MGDEMVVYLPEEMFGYIRYLAFPVEQFDTAEVIGGMDDICPGRQVTLWMELPRDIASIGSNRPFRLSQLVRVEIGEMIENQELERLKQEMYDYYTAGLPEISPAPPQS